MLASVKDTMIEQARWVGGKRYLILPLFLIILSYLEALKVRRVVDVDDFRRMYETWLQLFFSLHPPPTCT